MKKKKKTKSYAAPIWGHMLLMFFIFSVIWTTISFPIFIYNRVRDTFFDASQKASIVQKDDQQPLDVE